MHVLCILSPEHFAVSFAYVGGACVVNKRLEKVNSVAIIEDTGGFSGIIVAAHEVGHLLGAVHDGSPPPSYLGGPGAEKCRWEDGYIMSDLRHTEKGFRWSPCSVQSFHHFLKSPYDFKDFTTRPTVTASTTTTRKGFYKKEDFDGFFRRSTTKSPYQDKSIKPLFKIGTYYSQAKSSDNSIRPDANSQQVQIEPARLTFSFRRNTTTGELVRH
ncbi:hypothetical protein HF086_011978 [Spodoptera exigua]|uniref:Peptidase M12B domain-containing protein n=1 Tax=Spodoptera exigua TaxID=7107 RepID=A0A922MJ60_SPOEX|nr:hypothetical protein HF086_011978 [Spodoptera exigua]